MVKMQLCVCVRVREVEHKIAEEKMMPEGLSILKRLNVIMK